MGDHELAHLTLMSLVLILDLLQDSVAQSHHAPLVEVLAGMEDTGAKVAASAVTEAQVL